MAKCALVRVRKERDGIHKQAGLRARAKEGRHPARTQEEWSLEPGESWSCGRAALAKLVPEECPGTAGPSPLMPGPRQLTPLEAGGLGSLSGAAIGVCLPGTGHRAIWSRGEQRLVGAGCLRCFLRNPCCLDDPGPSEGDRLGKQTVRSQVGELRGPVPVLSLRDPGRVLDWNRGLPGDQEQGQVEMRGVRERMVPLQKGVEEKAAKANPPRRGTFMLLTFKTHSRCCSLYRYVLCPDCVQSLPLPCRSLSSTAVSWALPFKGCCVSE